MAEFADSIEIDAAPDAVFAFLTTPAGLTAWLGQHAEVEPHTGGTFAVDIAGHPIRGRYLQVERPHRVVVSWGVAGSHELAPGASTVTFTLTATETGTRVDLHHGGLPEAGIVGYADGWRHFLPRLRIVAGGGDPGPDHWRPLAD